MRALKQAERVYDAQRIASAALESFFNLSQRWGLTAGQERTLLGNPQESTFFKWKSERTARRLGQKVQQGVAVPGPERPGTDSLAAVLSTLPTCAGTSAPGGVSEAVSIPRQGAHLSFVWDGASIVRVFEKTRIV